MSSLTLLRPVTGQGRPAATTPIETMYLSAASTLISSSTQSLLRIEHEIAARGVGRGGHIHADVLVAQVAATSPRGLPVMKATVQTPSRGHCTSTAVRKALPLSENTVSETCLTLE